MLGVLSSNEMSWAVNNLIVIWTLSFRRGCVDFGHQ
ncbi:unnamed protein product [Penicillium roqueforti FM164]|uniref:Genomic scaffold, ProqFM164S02 n=1 Tax=Penicillium roqueforti (strain FM164) TaxID=1365484 RepID=W6QUD2_PENRF|nr:unnamed protein product [Penicillium roqueforti FM164]